MPREIPFSGASKEAMTISLAGQRLKLRARYANLVNAWTLDIFDAAGLELVPLVQGVAIVMGIDLLRPYPLGIGGIFAVANADQRTDAGRGELGTRVKLYHYTPDEMAAV